MTHDKNTDGPIDGPIDGTGANDRGTPFRGNDPRGRALEIAHDLGFDLAGIAPLEPPPDAARFDAWLAQGRHGSMDYLERGRAATVDPRSQWPHGKSLLVLGMGHSRAPLQFEGGHRVARYAAGRDYHNLIGKRLRKLRRQLEGEGICQPGSAFVDATPLLERSHAESAGLGFSSKAANLLHPRFGPWFFLAEVILDIELDSTVDQTPHGSCGTCTACIDACPTRAIVAPGEVDARRCISYATIEHRGLVDHELRENMDGWLFGCDVCSEVCPWGSKAPNLAERFGLRPELDPDGQDPSPGAVAANLLRAGRNAPDPDADHRLRFQGSPLKRPHRQGLARNAAMALGTRPTEVGLDALVEASKADPAPMVRAAAGWGLANGHPEDAPARRAAEALAKGDPDAGVRRDVATSLDRRG